MIILKKLFSTGCRLTAAAALLWGAAVHAQTSDVAAEKYYAANNMFNRKLYELAAEEYRGFIVRYPGNTNFLNAKLGLALSLYELGKYDEAQPIFAELARDRNAPHQEQVHNLWGQCLLIANRPNDAENAFRWSVNRGKERFFMALPGVAQRVQESPQISVGTVHDPLERAYAGLVEALYQQGKWKEVVDFAKELTDMVPDGQFSDRARFLSSLALHESGDFEAALTNLDYLIASKRDLPYIEHLHFLRAECLRQLNRLEQAEEGYEIVSRQLKRRFSSNAMFRLGYVKFTQKKYHSAIKDFSDLRAIYADSQYHAQAGIYLGRCYFELNELDRAQAVFGPLTTNPEVGAEATLWLAKVLLRQDKFRQATDLLREAVVKFAADPMVANLHFDYGNALMRLEDYQAAAAQFAAANAKAKDDELAANSLRLESFSLNRGEKYEESLAKSDTFLAKYPNNSFARDVSFLRSENLFFLNQTEEALKTYQQFIPWQGKDKYTNEARFRIAQALCKEENWRRALAELEILLNERDATGPFYEQARYLAGLAAFNLGNWGEAIRHFKEFLAAYPDRVNADSALIKMAQAQSERGESAAAAVDMERLIARYPTSPHVPQALAELGRYQYDLKQYPTATGNLQRLIKDYDGSTFLPQGYYYLAWIALNQEQLSEAAANFKMVWEKFPDSQLSPDSLFQNALITFRQNEMAVSQTLLKKFITSHPNDPRLQEARFYEAMSYVKQGNHTRSKELFDNFTKDYPKSSFATRATYEQAWAARESGDLEKAAASYNQIIASDPSGELADRATFELAELHYDAKKYDEAMALLDRLLARNVQGEMLEKVLNRMSWSYLGRNQEREALVYFERLLRQFPKSEFAATASYQAGELRLQSKEFENAYHNFLLAARSEGNATVREQALLRLGETQTLTERWKDAEATFASFLKDFPSSEFDRRASLWLAWSRENQKKYQQAIKDYQAILDDGTRDAIAARAQFQIGECYFAMGQYDDAIREHVKVELYPFPEWMARAILAVGQSLEKKGMREQATAEFRRVVDQFPTSDEAQLARELLRNR